MKTKRFALLLAVSLLFSVAASAVVAPGPMDQIKASVDEVLNILSNSKLEANDKKERISTIIRKRFYFRAMAQQTLAQNWRKATPDEQKNFVELFSRLVMATYMDRIEAYSNESVEFKREKIEEDRAVVDTTIVTTTVQIPISYKLVKKDGEWLVYDVVVEEVSLVRNYRSSYQDIVNKEGFTGLMAKMQEKIKSLEAPPGKTG
ncbi:MAG: putative toluene tolerance protein [Gammaproteobacteria bacterium]|nr:MAG: putative toluene tolerance protein [Gammaproteobacteria bacterium]TND06819.1 MAG: putative toluene tolerance protein [Gammaproteobacteria bacterium]